MRIRKRQVPLPFSSLPPLPLSDPLLPRSSAVQLPQTTEPFMAKSSHPPYTPTSSPLQPSNQTNRRSPVIGNGNNGCDSSDDASGAHKKENNLKCSRTEMEDDGEEEGKMGNNTSNRGFLSAATVNGFLLKSGPSSPEFGNWYGGERDFPPKKRRVNMEKRENEESSSTKMKTKMNKKCDEEERTKACIKTSTSKKRARGREIMEGSRCSRVNGRGWRCCQQTLVGYSLCEHHLGKGRLRSMTSVRSRSAATTAPSLQEKDAKRLEKEQEEEEDDDDEDDDDEDDDDEKKPLITAKKKMKLGMVKARSLSSLLGQTNSTVNMVDEIKDDDNQA